MFFLHMYLTINTNFLVFFLLRRGFATTLHVRISSVIVLLRCLCTYCEFCLQSLRKDDKVTCLVCKQESILREESVDNYTYHHSMISHDNLLEFDQPTFECAIEILESMKSLYPKGSCANCGRNKKKRKKANRYKLYQCNDCTTMYYCSNSCQTAHV